MSNEFTHDKMCVIAEKMAEETGMKMSLSKSLETWNMGADANSDEATSASDNSNDNGSDREYIAQEYRFEIKEGIVSSDADFEDIIDRNIPINRERSYRALAQIDSKGLRNPNRLDKVGRGMGRDLATKIDVYCYQRMINQATMIIANPGDFTQDQAIDAEVLMLNRGLGGYDKNLFLSNKHYANVAKTLGANQYYGKEGIPADALGKAMIPNLATFNTMRSDYLLNLTGNTSAGLVINGNQSHTVATYDAGNNFFLDNRFMTLAITGATTGTMPVGTKFSIAGVGALHPETREPTGDLLTLTVETTGAGSVVVAPAIVTSGPFRNASAIAADTAAVTILNIATSAPSMFYTPQSTFLIPGRLPIGDNAGVKSVEASTEQGLPMRMTYKQDFHGENYQIKSLVYFDCQVVYPDQLGLILSNQT